MSDVDHFSACKLCHSPRLRKLYTSGGSGVPVWKCGACGLAFFGKLLTPVEHAALYNAVDYQIFAETEHSVPELPQRHRDRIHFIEPWLRRGPGRPRLLDVGCGTADFLAMAGQMGFDVVGQDISFIAARLAREWHGITVDVQELDAYAAGSFDVVTLIGVLEHVLDPRAVVTAAARLLVPGGLLYAYTPRWGAYDVMASSMARISHGRLSWAMDRRINHWHLQIFPESTLVALLADLGLQTMAIEAVCEYNLPIPAHLQKLGVRHQRTQQAAAAAVAALIDRNLFFRNNVRVVACAGQ